MTAITQQNDDEPDIKLNDPSSPLDDTYILIVADSSFPLSPELTSTITDPSALDAETPDFLKVLSLLQFTKSLLYNHNDPLILLLPASALYIAPDPRTVKLLIPDEILILLFILLSSTINEWCISFYRASQTIR